MSSGPIVIFDKSLLEALSLDETVWLGQFYRINMTPLFFVETLADLEKAPRDDRTPEQVVERLAEKTTAISADPNALPDCATDLRPRRMRRCRMRRSSMTCSRAEIEVPPGDIVLEDPKRSTQPRR
jgi:hypothetical protein